MQTFDENPGKDWPFLSTFSAQTFSYHYGFYGRAKLGCEMYSKPSVRLIDRQSQVHRTLI